MDEVLRAFILERTKGGSINQGGLTRERASAYDRALGEVLDQLIEEEEGIKFLHDGTKQTNTQFYFELEDRAYSFRFESDGERKEECDSGSPRYISSRSLVLTSINDNTTLSARIEETVDTTMDESEDWLSKYTLIYRDNIKDDFTTKVSQTLYERLASI